MVCLISAFALAAALLSIVGCGGGSSKAVSGRGGSAASVTSTSAPGSPAGARSGFIARADRICGRVNAGILAIKVTSGSAAEARRVVPRTVSLERQGIAALEGLNPPASLARDWRRMLGYRRALASALGRLLEIARRNDGTSIKSLSAEKQRAHLALSETAKANGFTDCATVGRVD